MLLICSLTTPRWCTSCRILNSSRVFFESRKDWCRDLLFVAERGRFWDIYLGWLSFNQFWILAIVEEGMMGLGIAAVRRICVHGLVLVYVTVLISSVAYIFRFGISEAAFCSLEQFLNCISSFLSNRNSIAKLTLSLSFGFLLSIGVYLSPFLREYWCVNMLTSTLIIKNRLTLYIN